MKKIILLSFLPLFFFSCIKPLLRKNGIIDKKAILQKLNYQNKDILFLGMTHISQQPFYDECKKIIDSLSVQGYYILGEGVQADNKIVVNGKEIASQEDTINSKKIRKILGIDIAFYGESKFFKDFSKKYQLVEQPASLYMNHCKKGSNLGKFLDYTSKELVSTFEKEKGEVILNECDIKTPIGQEYKCEKSNKKDRNFFIDEIAKKKRDALIAKEIKETTYQKILIVYGEGHYQRVKKLLEGKQK